MLRSVWQLQGVVGYTLGGRVGLSHYSSSSSTSSFISFFHLLLLIFLHHLLFLLRLVWISVEEVEAVRMGVWMLEAMTYFHLTTTTATSEVWSDVSSTLPTYLSPQVQSVRVVTGFCFHFYFV
ncbi:hypothetical protein Hamer_G023502 [Homarus americanus]|uniref:Uncharacterized protein n=1 Tax=Homarus americanus TaxID=6706 RepID=A0A8J5MRP5_HOMAM|nr:hypothetical protein Hamer_G023502 [Homarus americanus]